MAAFTKPVTSRTGLPRLSRQLEGIEDSGSDALPETIVQFGTGGFLRGFVDAFVEQANRRGEKPAGRVVVVGSTSSGRVSQLAEQEGLYTLSVRGRAGGEVVDETNIIRSISRALSAAEAWPEVLSLSRSPHIHTIASNTTEVGITYDREDRPDLQPPRSFPGKLTAFLAERARHFDYAADRGVVILPCELIENNGERLQDIVLKLARDWQLGQRFTEWLGDAVVFCNTLVDRIVPGTPDDAERLRLNERIGYDDRLLTVAEPYRLWAIQLPDGQSADRISLLGADDGIILADDIRPYRERKVRILNGTHTAIVPAALLFGFTTVAETVDHENFGCYVKRMVMEEIVPSLDVDREMATAFAEDVLERFANPFIRHELLDISLQQTAKIGVRVLPSLRGYVERYGAIPPLLTFALAAFVVYKLQSCLQEGLPHDDANDFWQDMAALDERVGMDAVIGILIADSGLWQDGLADLPGFAEAVRGHVEDIRTDGIAAALTVHLAGPAGDRPLS